MASSNANPALLAPYAAQINASASRWGVDPTVLGAIILHESGGHAGVVNSSSGASGLGQILPSTASGYGLSLAKLRGTSASDAAYQIDAAAQVLSGFQKAHPGNTTAALEGYGGQGSNLYGDLQSNGFIDAARRALGYAGGVLSLANPIANVGRAAQGAGDAASNVPGLSSIDSAVQWFTDPQNWLRVLIGVTGLALVIGGLLHAAGSSETVREGAEVAAIAA